MADEKEQRRAEAARKVRHRKAVSGTTKEIRTAAGKRLIAGAMRQLEEGANLETDAQKSKATVVRGRNRVYETPGAALAALQSGVITPEAAAKIAKRIEREVRELKLAISAAGSDKSQPDQIRGVKAARSKGCD